MHSGDTPLSALSISRSKDLYVEPNTPIAFSRSVMREKHAARSGRKPCLWAAQIPAGTTTCLVVLAAGAPLRLIVWPVNTLLIEVPAPSVRVTVAV